jgi:hypothetical protein
MAGLCQRPNSFEASRRPTAREVMTGELLTMPNSTELLKQQDIQLRMLRELRTEWDSAPLEEKSAIQDSINAVEEDVVRLEQRIRAEILRGR